jgi:hypothetical protein
MPVTQTSPNIKSKPPKKWRSSEKIWIPVWEDKDGNPIDTSAGFLSVKPHYEQYAIAIYHFVKFKDYSDSEFAAEINALNSGAWGGFEKWQAWISEIHSPGITTVGDSTGEEVHYVVRCIDRHEGWRFRMPDCGYVYDDGANIKSFMSQDNVPYIGNLDGAGDDGGSSMVMQKFDTKKTIDFNAVNGLS